MADDETREDEDLPTVGSGRLDALFDDLEATVESLDDLADELTTVRRRIEADEGETSGHVRNRITQDAEQLAEELDENAERLGEALRSLEEAV